MKNFVLTHMSKEEDRQTFLQWDKKCLEDVSEEIRKNENGRKRGKKLKSKTLRKTKSRGLAVAGRSAL